MSIIKVYPVRDDAKTVDFRLSKEQARRVATILLIALETSEEIFLQGDRENNTVWVAKYR